MKNAAIVFLAVLSAGLLLASTLMAPMAVGMLQMESQQEYIDAAVSHFRRGDWKAGMDESVIYVEKGFRGPRIVAYDNSPQRGLLEYYIKSERAYISLYFMNRKLVAAHYLSDHQTDEWFCGGPASWVAGK